MPKKKRYCSQEQKRYLKDYIKNHKEIDFIKSQVVWWTIATELNSIEGGAVKNGKDWKRTWIDLRYKEKKRAELRMQEQLNDAMEVPPLAQLSQIGVFTKIDEPNLKDPISLPTYNPEVKDNLPNNTDASPHVSDKSKKLISENCAPKLKTGDLMEAMSDSLKLKIELSKSLLEVVRNKATMEERKAMAEERKATAEERKAMAEERKALAEERKATAEERRAEASERKALAMEQQVAIMERQVVALEYQSASAELATAAREDLNGKVQSLIDLLAEKYSR